MKAMVVQTRQETPDVRSFLLRPEKPLEFRAGQYLTMFLDVPEDRARPFSIASSPTEGNLLVATKFREPPSLFKKRMNRLKPGDAVEIQGPFGRFVLPGDFTKQVMLLAGGIGVTPFRSMIEYCTIQRLRIEITLLYSNRTAADIAFRADLERWQGSNPAFRLVHTLTEDPSWPGQKGRIDEALVRKHLKGEETLFYLCGPPGMVTGLAALLQGMGIPEERMRAERFAGY